MNKVSLPLCIADELRISPFAFSERVTVRVSLANPGAEDLANELAKSFAGLTVSTAEEADDATHMLLYLNQETWSDERLAEQVKQAREDKLKIVMAHENDPEKGGCIFARFFETTPQELIADGLYRDIAHPCFPRAWPHHEVSLVLLAKNLGATATKGLHARASADLRHTGSSIRRTLGSLVPSRQPGRNSRTRGSVSTEPSRFRPSVSTEPSLPHTISMEPEPTSTPESTSEKRLGKSRTSEAGSSRPIVPRDIALKYAEEQRRGSSSKQLSRV